MGLANGTEYTESRVVRGVACLKLISISYAPVKRDRPGFTKFRYETAAAIGHQLLRKDSLGSDGNHGVSQLTSLFPCNIEIMHVSRSANEGLNAFSNLQARRQAKVFSLKGERSACRILPIIWGSNLISHRAVIGEPRALTSYQRVMANPIALQYGTHNNQGYESINRRCYERSPSGILYRILGTLLPLGFSPSGSYRLFVKRDGRTYLTPFYFLSLMAGWGLLLNPCSDTSDNGEQTDYELSHGGDTVTPP